MKRKDKNKSHEKAARGSLWELVQRNGRIIGINVRKPR